jgi:hypothetical protein
MLCISDTNRASLSFAGLGEGEDDDDDDDQVVTCKKTFVLWTVNPDRGCFRTIMTLDSVSKSLCSPELKGEVLEKNVPFSWRPKTRDEECERGVRMVTGRAVLCTGFCYFSIFFWFLLVSVVGWTKGKCGPKSAPQAHTRVKHEENEACSNFLKLSRPSAVTSFG